MRWEDERGILQLLLRLPTLHTYVSPMLEPVRSRESPLGLLVIAKHGMEPHSWVFPSSLRL